MEGKLSGAMTLPKTMGPPIRLSDQEWEIEIVKVRKQQAHSSRSGVESGADVDPSRYRFSLGAGDVRYPRDPSEPRFRIAVPSSTSTESVPGRELLSTASGGHSPSPPPTRAPSTVSRAPPTTTSGALRGLARFMPRLLPPLLELHRRVHRMAFYKCRATSSHDPVTARTSRLVIYGTTRTRILS